MVPKKFKIQNLNSSGLDKQSKRFILFIIDSFIGPNGHVKLVEKKHTKAHKNTNSMNESIVNKMNRFDCLSKPE